MEKVDKIKVAITRKVNIGGFENIDYRLGIDIVGFDPKSMDKVQKAIDFGRELCLKDTSEYYKKVKDELTKAKPLDKGIDKKYLDIEEKINQSKNESQLRALTDKVNEIDDKKMQLTIQKMFNLKLISLKS